MPTSGHPPAAPLAKPFRFSSFPAESNRFLVFFLLPSSPPSLVLSLRRTLFPFLCFFAVRFIGPSRLMSAPPAFLLAGALAGACASGMTTPFDVLKTRVSSRK